MSAVAGTGTRRSARLTAKPTQTYVLEFPQITDAEESDEDDSVEYDFRWQGGALVACSSCLGAALFGTVIASWSGRFPYLYIYNSQWVAPCADFQLGEESVDSVLGGGVYFFYLL